MKNLFLALVTLLCLSFATQAQSNLSYFLPQDVEYDPAIPTPASVIGHEVGEWHVSHDRLVGYMYALAAASDRVTIAVQGYTYERRPQVLLTITSPENHQNLEQIRTDHLRLSDPTNRENLDIEKMPIVLSMGYSIHGDEASGSNAAMLVAYYLAAAQGSEIEQQLAQSVILLDPAFNPDGLNRFASWVNMHRGHTPNPDPADREHDMAWPAGRTNHYWFDLNRDWLPLQHPESRSRITTFHHWKPNVLTDHHEMGTHSTFFFQPGVPSRKNPLTPLSNQDLTTRIAHYHARALDSIGSRYYTQERYDDFYYGKGSTYPDVNGAVGILFEQASSRGHAQENPEGILTFPFAIRNHVVTSFSTLEGALAIRQDLLAHQRQFFKESLREGEKDVRKAFVFGDAGDPQRAAELAKILLMHKIAVYEPAAEIRVGEQVFLPNSSYLVPLAQAQYRLIRSCFETLTEFEDSIFYDISTWTLPLAFGVEYAALGKAYPAGGPGNPLTKAASPAGKIMGDADADYAYLFGWQRYYSPAALHSLLDAGVRAWVATEIFELSGLAYDRGTILIPIVGQALSAVEIKTLMESVAAENGVEVFRVSSGFSVQGIDLGSTKFEPLELPRIALVVGGGVSSYGAGEVWHLLDYRFGIPVTLLTKEKFNSTSLDRYTTLILADGSYNALDGAKMREWLTAGGTLIATQRALRWIDNQGLAHYNFRSMTQPKTDPFLPYAEKASRREARDVPGSIFHTQADLSHPLLYGYTRSLMPIFRKHSLIVEPSMDPYSTPLRYTATPLISGYVPGGFVENLSGSAALSVSVAGRGHVVAFTDDPNFRGFWYGTQKLFLNAIFFGPIIR